MVMSAVSSVRTPGVFVTVTPRSTAVATSILSTPAPKFAIKRSCSPACDRILESIRSVTVGTSTSARLTASMSRSGLIGVSSWFSSASKSSHMRVSISAGSLRVTTTLTLGAGMVATS